jgi:hypothetical protein
MSDNKPVDDTKDDKRASPTSRKQAETIQAMEQMFDEWWSSHFHGSPVARDTEVYNHTYAAVQELKRRLIGMF